MAPKTSSADSQKHQTQPIIWVKEVGPSYSDGIINSLNAAQETRQNMHFKALP